MFIAACLGSRRVPFHPVLRDVGSWQPCGRTLKAGLASERWLETKGAEACPGRTLFFGPLCFALNCLPGPSNSHDCVDLFLRCLLKSLRKGTNKTAATMVRPTNITTSAKSQGLIGNVLSIRLRVRRALQLVSLYHSVPGPSIGQ